MGKTFPAGTAGLVSLPVPVPLDEVCVTSHIPPKDGATVLIQRFGQGPRLVVEKP